MNKLTLIGISTATALTAGGCSGKVLPSTETQQDASTAPAPVAAISVNGFTRASNGSALGGVNVCLEPGLALTERPGTCVVSGLDGSFAVWSATTDSSATLTFRHVLFQPLLHPLLTQAHDITLEPADTTLLPDMGTFMGVRVDASRGQVPFVVKPLSGPVRKVSATATVLDAFSGFDGDAGTPVYADESGTLPPGVFSGPSGGFVNLRPGLYEFRFDFAATCTAVASIDHYATNGPHDVGSGRAALHLVVRGGYFHTPIEVACLDEPPWAPP